MLARLVVLFVCVGFLAGCVTATPNKQYLAPVQTIDDETSTLDSWWSFFNDPVLDRFISSAIDLNYNNNDISKDEIALDIARKYAQYRYIQSQKNLLTAYVADKNAVIDVDTAKQSSKIKSQQIELLKKKIKLENNEIDISLKIAKLTKLLPEYVSQILKKEGGIPNADITPVFASSSSIVFNSPDIRKASLLFVKDMAGKVSLSDIKNIFPDMTFSRFFGIPDDVYLNNRSRWSISVGSSIRNLDLAALESRFGNKASYKEFIDNIYTALVSIEHKIISYANMQEQYMVLKDAANEYEKECIALKNKHPRKKLSIETFSEICDEAYRARLAALRAEYENINILNDLYEIILKTKGKITVSI